MIGVTTTLEVLTLGRFEVRRSQKQLTGGNWNRRKVVDLFKLLLSVEQHRLHREQVQEILWPTSTLEQAANSFGKTLYLLRRALEPDLPSGKGSSSNYIHLEHDTLLLMIRRWISTKETIYQRICMKIGHSVDVIVCVAFIAGYWRMVLSWH